MSISLPGLAAKIKNSSLRRFLKHFSEAIEQGDAAVFAGAGLSRPSGYVDWKELLREIAEDLELDIDRESDLIAIAQYYSNKKAGRSQLNRLLIKEFTKDAKPNHNHALIARCRSAPSGRQIMTP